MEKPIKKSYRKTQDQDTSNFLIICTFLVVIIAIWISIYYNQLKQRIGYLIKNIKLKNLYNNLLDDPLENTDEFNIKAKKISNSYGPFMYIQNINYRILNIVNFKYSISSFLNDIQSPFSYLRVIEELIDEIDFVIPKKFKNINTIYNKNKGKNTKDKVKNGSNPQTNLQKKKKKQRQRLIFPENHVASSTSTIPSSPVPIFYESFIIQKASTTPSTSSSSLITTTVASLSSTSATTISSKSLSSSTKTLVTSTPSITSINNASYKSTSSVVSIVAENDKNKKYPNKKIEDKKKKEKEEQCESEEILALATTSSVPSNSIPSSVVIEEIEENDHKLDECPVTNTKNVIKYSEPITSIDAMSVISHSSHDDISDDEDTCYDSYISSDASDNYSTTSELSDSEDDVIILINPEQDLSFLSPRTKNNTDEISDSNNYSNNNNNNNDSSYPRNDKMSRSYRIENEESRRNGQLLIKKESMHKNVNELVENKKKNSTNSLNKPTQISTKNTNKSKPKNNISTKTTKSTNASTSSLQTLISSHDDLTQVNNTPNTNASLSPKPTTDMLLSSFKEPYLVKSIISTTSSIQQSPSLSVSSVFSEQSDSSSATLVHPSYSQISTTSTFSTKDTLTASTTELTVKSSAILEKEQGQNCSPNINVNISINNNSSSTTTSPSNDKTTTVNKSSVVYSSGSMRVNRRNKHYYPSVVSHSRSYGSVQRHMIKPLRRSKNYSNNQGYYFIPQHYLRNSSNTGERLIPIVKTDYINTNGSMTNPYCPLIYNTATPYIITTTPNGQGLSMLSPMILYPTQTVATVVSSTPFNNSNYIIINNSPNLNQLNGTSSLISSTSLRRYSNHNKRFNKKRPIYIPYFKKNNSNNYYHDNHYNMNNKKLITSTSIDNTNESSNKTIVLNNNNYNNNNNNDNGIIKNTINISDKRVNNDKNNSETTTIITTRCSHEKEGHILTDIEINSKNNNNKEYNQNQNNKSINVTSERKLFKSKRFNNQRIQKKNIFNVHKPTFHKTFKKSPIKNDNEYYYQPIPVIAQPNSQYVFFNTYNNNQNYS